MQTLKIVVTGTFATGKTELIKTIREIDEQLATKQLAIGRHYQKVGNMQAANLYYDMIVRDWKNSKAAESAREMLAKNRDLMDDPQTSTEK